MKNKLLFVAVILATQFGFASDHIDGPVTTGHRVADLSDLFVFPTPGKAGSVSIILDTYPIVSASGHFSDKVTYNLFLRRASIRPEGQPIGFDTSDEVTMSCTFQTPQVTSEHVVTCKTNTGLTASSKYQVVQDKREGDDFRVFAGMRSDPFFFDAYFATTLGDKGVIPRHIPINIMDGINCLSLIFEIDVNKLFKTNPPTLIAVTAQSTADGNTRQLDRLGRPEITNVSMVAHNEPDLRDQFNLDRPFMVKPEMQKMYFDRLAKNIAFYDKVDGQQNWNDQDRLALAGILADDFLVVDLSKPCDKPGFLEIEKSMLQHKPYQTCGGRKPTDGIMETLFTLYIGGFNGPRVSDGITEPSQPVSNKFPYLAQPTTGLLGAAKALLAKKALGIHDNP